MTRRVEGSGLTTGQGLNTTSPETMRQTSIGKANFGVYSGSIDGTPPGGGAGSADLSNEILQGESFAEQTKIPGIDTKLS